MILRLVRRYDARTECLVVYVRIVTLWGVRRSHPSTSVANAFMENHEDDPVAFKEMIDV